jgi:hypothetical protein
MRGTRHDGLDEHGDQANTSPCPSGRKSRSTERVGSSETIFDVTTHTVRSSSDPPRPGLRLESTGVAPNQRRQPGRKPGAGFGPSHGASQGGRQRAGGRGPRQHRHPRVPAPRRPRASACGIGTSVPAMRRRPRPGMPGNRSHAASAAGPALRRRRSSGRRAGEPLASAGGAYRTPTESDHRRRPMKNDAEEMV